VANAAKPMPPEFINPKGNYVTPACLDYLRPLVGPLPEYVRLAAVRA
jgi:6-phosphofructokinase 1